MEKIEYIAPKFKKVNIEHRSSICQQLSNPFGSEGVTGVDGGGLDE